MQEKKHMSHLRNIVEAIEDRGYLVVSIGYDADRVSIVVENPGYAGNHAFLEKARDQEGQKKLMTREEFDRLPPDQKSEFTSKGGEIKAQYDKAFSSNP
jgi:nicotinamide mononucleotide adenylyltransferase